MPSSLSYRIIADCYLRNRNFCSTDYQYCLNYINDVLPGRQHRFTAGQEKNGWEIGPKWDLINAGIYLAGERLLDATQHPLQLIGLCAPFSGSVLGKEIKEHLHVVSEADLSSSAIPFHFRQFYRPWERDWGFCVTRNFYDTIVDDAEYEVVIETEESEGYLDVYEYHHVGQSELTFCFVAHLDHPGMANDDLAGCAVGVEFFKNLVGRETRYSYKLLLVQEIIGSYYYLEALTEYERKSIIGASFLEMLGGRQPLMLQRSYRPNPVEDALLPLLRRTSGWKDESHLHDFRKLIGNDEIVFESFGIPMCSLARFPYPEYHSSDDNLGIIAQKSLSEAVSVLMDVVDVLEKEIFYRKNFTGIVCLGNPRFGLYVGPGSFPEHSEAINLRVRDLMDFLAFLERPYSAMELAEKFKLPLDLTCSYLSKWVEKGLLITD